MLDPVLVALAVSVCLATALAGRAHLDVRAAYAAGVCGVAGAVLGGALWALWSTGGSVARDALALVEGPKGAIGAALGAGLAATTYLAVTRRAWLSYADAMAPAGFIGYAIARVGCLIEGCCDGALAGVPIAAWHMTAGIALAAVTWRAGGRTGRPLSVALAGYGAARVLLGYWRSDAEVVALGLNADQIAAVGLFMAGAALAVGIRSRRGRAR
jgi:prolipoprotein diacylglyceryltransferase